MASNPARTRPAWATSTAARLLDLHPIDDAARDGRHYLVFDGRTQPGRFAVAAWRASPAGGEWQFPGGQPIGFDPVEYQP